MFNDPKNHQNYLKSQTSNSLIPTATTAISYLSTNQDQIQNTDCSKIDILVSQNICATSTCTFKGYGFDNSTYKHGQWTYFFLNTFITRHFNNKSVYDIYIKAKREYILKCKLEDINQPQMVGNKNLTF